MKTVLGIDTSTLTASVALVRGDADACDVLAERASGVNTHSQQLIGLVDQVLAGSSRAPGDLDGICVGAGPGSFTGLRIGMATAKGLAFAAGKPLWTVSSLAALALAVDSDAGVAAGALVVPIMDARRKEIFVGFYRVAGGVAEPVASELVLPPARLREAIERVLATCELSRAIALGDGLATYPEPIEQALAGLADIARDAPATPPARCVARLALTGAHEDRLDAGAPSYVRLSEVELKFPHGNPGGAFSPRQ